MDRKFRVLHLITRLELGGAQQNTLYCTAHHDRELFDVDLVAGQGGILDAEAAAIPDADVALIPQLKHPIAPLWDLVALLRLRSRFRTRRVDLVHTHSSKAGILGRIAAWLAGVPVIVHTVHGWSFNETQPGWLRRLYVWLERLAARVTDRIVVVSSMNREKGLAEGIGRPEQYVVVHSGIDAGEFAMPDNDRTTVRRALGFGAEHVVVGTVACMKPQKAPLDFVRAAHEAYRQDDRLRFFIAGDGELMPDVRALVRELDMDGIVHLLGWRRDVVDLLHATDVFLLTSLFEGLPRVVLQAMAAGVPVVATAVDGTPEVVEDGVTGLLVGAGRADEAARAVLRLARDESLRERCIERARTRLTREFDVEQMVRDLDRLYLTLLARERPTVAGRISEETAG